MEAGQDPEDDCLEQLPSTCGNDGTCDGQGACRDWEPGTLCQEQYCEGFEIHYADECDGAGECFDNGYNVCCPYMCDPSANGCLPGTCEDDGDCCNNTKCVDSSCVPK